MNTDINVKWVPIDSLTPSAKNPNTHPEDQIEDWVKVLRYQGFRLPIVVSNRTGEMVAGHGRLEAAKRMGLTKVPVSHQDFDDWDQEFSFMTSDNAMAQRSFLDLAKINAELESLGPIDIDLLGIKEFEVEPLDKFDEPGEKSEPKDKEGELNTCPNCGVMLG